jgi:hypothetical protein
MLRRLLQRARPRSAYDVMAAIACFGVLAGGTAYAANTIGSTDIIDGQVKSVDVGDGEILSADVKDQSLTTFDVSTFLGADVADGTLTGADLQDESVTRDDIQNFTLGNGDFLDGSVDTRVVTNNSLTGSDIDESSLSVPQALTEATFTGIPLPPVYLGASFVEVAGRDLPAGSYAISATASTDKTVGTVSTTTTCDLRNGTAFIGEAFVSDTEKGTKQTLSMNGGAQVPAGGGRVTLQCKNDGVGVAARVKYAQMMIIRLDRFF